MFGRKKKVEGDEVTQMLVKQGVYQTNSHYDHPFHMDSKAIKKKKVYGFWAGVKYTIILSVLLFWIPPFGQMIAGYVGGRKAGSPVKGFLATMIPVFFVFLLYGLVWVGIISGFDELWTRGFDAISSVASSIPIIGPIMDFSLDYLGFFSQYIGMGSAWLASYALIPLFGYAGGVMSLHHKRELKEYEYALEKAISALIQPKVVPVAVGQGMGGGEEQPIAMDGDIPIIMGKKPEGWDE